MYDCQACGACCKNLPSNLAEGARHWVEIEAGDAVLRQTALVKLHVVYDEEQTPHLRMTPDGRCLALSGAVGRRVRCRIYHHRPSPCRRVHAGDALCLQYRAAHGLT